MGIIHSLEIIHGRSDRPLYPHDVMKDHSAAAVYARIAELSKRENCDTDEYLVEDTRQSETKKIDIYKGDSWFESTPILKLIKSRVDC